jgi:hypothetical protein
MTGHVLLLRLAGRIPDAGLTAVRRQFADGDVRGAMTVVTQWVAGDRIPLLADELAAIRVLAGNPEALPGVAPVPDLPELPFAFSAVDRYGEIEADQLDGAVSAVAEGYGVAGLWRSWRYPLDPDAPTGALTVTVDADDPDQAYRVYVVQVEDLGGIRDLARELLRVVDEIGSAGIEVISLDAEPPPYQDLALADSMLLWAQAGEPEFELAAVFDFADPVTGPGFAPDHVVLDDPQDREQLLDYLRDGVPVLMTTAAMDDIIDPAAGAVVPANFRTDGEWIWTDAVIYYLDRHGIAPDARLAEHVLRKLADGEDTVDVDDETAGRAADFLLNPAPEPEEPARSPGADVTAGT